ncbi:ATP-dependent DNA helicase Rep [anaerobic digester metagenome]
MTGENMDDINLCGLFQDFEYLVEKGKGYSIYNASNEMFLNFVNALKDRVCDEFINIRLSNYNADCEVNKKIPIVIFQDLDFNELTNKADDVVNKLIYPAWYRGCTIFFISKIDKSYYNIGEIKSSLIHSDYRHVLNLLSLEQMDSLLDFVNIIITSPEMITEFKQNVIYTPIEKIFSEKLIENGISFKPQVKLGRFYVDFLVEFGNSKIIVECDGREYHNPNRDRERDKELKKEGYKIFRFSGSMLFNDCDGCVDKVIRYNKSSSNSKYVLEELNEEQMVAVNHIAGPMRLLAPAGAGKTKTLINRIINLINNGIHESEILALAFNKRAELEMRKRLIENYGLGNVEIKTFHSFGNEVIRKILQWRFNGDKQAQITKSLLEEVVNKYEKIVYQRNKDPMDEYLTMLSKAKNDLLPFNGMVIETVNNTVNFEPIFKAYIKRSMNENFYNYDDMLYFAVRLLLHEPSLRRKIQNQYKYLLVDEFQDLNKVQLLLLQILALPQNNLFVVGDDDQMIYGFRGAEVRHILDFNERYSITSDQVLKINYRSCSEIVRHSRWLIDHNKCRVSKDIIPFSEERGSLCLFVGDSLKGQVEKIAQWLLENKNENTKWSDFAILYRYNQYSDLLYMNLSKFNIPVHFDGVKVLNSGVGRCILSYLTVIYDNKSSKPEHFKEILKKPNKYLTNELINKIISWNDFINIDFAKSNLREMDIDRYSNFVKKVEKLSNNIESKSASNIINAIVEEFGLKQFYKDQSQFSSDIDVASDYDVLEIIMSYSESFESIDKFYKYWINIGQEKDKNAEDESDEKANDKVVLTTIHKTKGNEYKKVAFFNLSSRITEKAKEAELEEERRVAYVGVTRPRKALIVTTQKGEISPFIREFFLNPGLSNIRNEELQDRISTLNTEINVHKINIDQIDEQISELVTQYPELNGVNYEITGWFKKIKRNIRNKQVNSALEKFKQLNEQKKPIYNKNKQQINEKIDIAKELEYRNLIEQSEEINSNEKIDDYNVETHNKNITPLEFGEKCNSGEYKSKSSESPKPVYSSVQSEYYQNAKERADNDKINKFHQKQLEEKSFDESNINESMLVDSLVKIQNNSSNIIDSREEMGDDVDVNHIGRSCKKENNKVLNVLSNTQNKNPHEIVVSSVEQFEQSSLNKKSICKEVNSKFRPNTAVINNEFGKGIVISNDLRIVKVEFQNRGIVSFSYEACVKDGILRKANITVDLLPISKLLELSDEKYMKNEFGKEAIMINCKIIFLNKDSIKHYLRLAECYKKQNQYDEAIATYSEILRIDKNNSEAKSNLSYLQNLCKTVYKEFMKNEIHEDYY